MKTLLFITAVLFAIFTLPQDEAKKFECVATQVSPVARSG